MVQNQNTTDENNAGVWNAHRAHPLLLHRECSSRQGEHSYPIGYRDTSTAGSYIRRYTNTDADPPGTNPNAQATAQTYTNADRYLQTDPDTHPPEANANSLLSGCQWQSLVL